MQWKLCNKESQEDGKEENDSLGEREIKQDEEAEDDQDEAEEDFGVRGRVHGARVIDNRLGYHRRCGADSRRNFAVDELQRWSRAVVLHEKKAPAWGAVEEVINRPRYSLNCNLADDTTCRGRNKRFCPQGRDGLWCGLFLPLFEVVGEFA